jgi:hypothetical protein
MKTDLELLDECIEQEDRIGSVAAEAFRRWRGEFESRRRVLSPRERQWLDDCCRRLGIDDGTMNLVSTGAVKVTQAERDSLGQFYLDLGPKPLAPPGRRK